jgi:hypothetical protein
VFLNHFDVLISRINFKQYYFNVFLSGKHFETQLLLHSKTGSEKRHWILAPFLFLRNFLCAKISTSPYVLYVLRVTWVYSGFHFLFFSLFEIDFFLISSFNIRLLAHELHDFFRISFYMVILILYPCLWVSQVNSCFFFFTFFNWFFFNFALHHLVCLRVDRLCFIQFFYMRLS